MALVMGIAGLDTYVHRMIVWRIDPRYELPKALRKLGVQFGDFADMSDEWLASQQAGSRSRPWVRAKNLLHERLLRECLFSLFIRRSRFGLVEVMNRTDQAASCHWYR